MKWIFFTLVLILPISGFSELIVEEMQAERLYLGPKWCVKKVKLKNPGREPVELFTIASPEKMAIRQQGAWLILACSSPNKALYKMKFKGPASYKTPKNYSTFRKEMMLVLGGLKIVKEKHVRWVNKGIIHRMDLDIAPKGDGKVTVKMSVIATKESFFFLSVFGDTTFAGEFFDNFTPLNTG